MFRDITIGQYYPVDSAVHRLDPRTKLFAVFAFIVALFIIQSPILYIPYLIILIGMYRLAKVPFGYLMNGLKGIVILLVFTLVFRALITPGDVIAEFWIFEVTKEGIFKAIQLTSRIALMIVSASLLSYTSTPRELADGLEKSMSFLKTIHVPIDDMAVMVMIAFRFIPIMIEEANTLADAQAARGVEFEKCSILQKCKNVFAILIPLFMSTLRKASDLALAMEARGFKPGARTTRMYPMEYSAADKKVYVFTILFVAVIAVLEIAVI